MSSEGSSGRRPSSDGEGRARGRALDILGTLDLSAHSVRADLAGARSCPGYLYSVCELLDHAIDVLTEAAGLVHDNERRWRGFRGAVDRAVGPSGRSPEERTGGVSPSATGLTA